MEAGSAVPPERAPDAAAPARDLTAKPSPRASSVRDDEGKRPVNWLAHVFLVLGIGLLLICVIDIANAARHLPAAGPITSAAEALRRMGYGAGIVLYTSSARVLTGFALVAGGVLTSRMSDDGSGWDRAIRVAGLVMGGVSVVYFVTALLIVIPFAPAPYALKPMLPPLWAALPVLLITGGSLLGAGFLMAARLSRERESFLLQLRRPQSREAAGTEGEQVKPYDMEHGGR